MEIKHPEWLQVEENYPKQYGYNQDWYGTSFQKTRGCGPTTAAMLLLYLNIREGEPLPYKGNGISNIKMIMEDVWKFVTPGWLLGLNSTAKFCTGIEAFTQSYGLSWKWRKLSITAFQSKRPSLAQVIQFLEKGIASDCPIAFLNLHKGQVTNLESWHWIVLVSLSYDIAKERYMATCYDSGYLITFDVDLWLKTTRFGGGFVYITVEEAKTR